MEGKLSLLTFLPIIRMFIWLSMHDAIQVNANRFRRNLVESAACSRCSSPWEDTMHCLRDCPHSKELWLKMGAVSWANFNVLEIKEWISSQALSSNGVKLLACVWGIWKWRNNMIFEEHHWPLRKLGVGSVTITMTLCVLFPGSVKLNVDGSFADWQDCMGGGGLIRDEHGKWLIGFMSFSKGGNPFIAGIMALKEVLLLAWANNYKEVICETDCAEIIKDLDNLESLRFQPIIQDIKLILNRRWKVSINLVNRDCNKVAHCLANMGRTSAFQETQIVHVPSSDMDTLLLRDCSLIA
ncbi:hypothetical protein OROGR_027501 [Orobanche gracilis]